MRLRSARVSLLVPLLGLACGPPAEVAEPEPEAVPIAGMYAVRGVTITPTSGHRREIAGTIVLTRDGDSYTATFDLDTTYPGADQALPADVIGKGAGTISGRTLLGEAETQLVMATVPGVDPGFAYVPRMVSTRIASKTRATVAADGSLTVEIENQGAPGEDYTPTRTTLSGQRVSAAGVGGAVAASEESGSRTR